MADEIFGFIGLGNMGGPMARHTAATGRETVVHDIAGTADPRTPRLRRRAVQRRGSAPGRHRCPVAADRRF